MNNRLVSCMAAVCLLVFAVSALAVEEEQPVNVQTHLKRVALFKNGFGFFVREGTLAGDRRVAVVGPFAVPSHGTFWVTAPSRAGFLGALAREVTRSEDIAAREVADLLRGNVGRRVRLWLGFEPETALTGTLIAFAPDRMQPLPDPYGLGRGIAPSAIISPPGRGQFLLLETDDGIVALDPYRVARVDFPEGEPSTTFPGTTTQVELEATFERPAAGDWLSVSYLARGITWAPSYLIDITDPKEARLSAKAVIINEAEDLSKTHVDLITGFPNLAFADAASPLSMRQDLASFLQSLTGDRRRMRADVTTQRALYSMAEAARPALALPVPDYGDAAAGQVAADLFFYPIEGVTLGKGETGYYPLFSVTVPYSEFYEWKIPDYIGAEGRYRRQREDQPEEPEIVWHSIRLTNATSTPWTTAPAQLMRDGRIVGQDTLNYTALKAETAVKITQAVSVKAEQTEIETSRERDAVRLYGDHFDRVTIEGTLRVTNYKDERISMEITKILSGEVKKTSPRAEDTTLARGLKSMNPTHELTWKFDMKPGEGREITYVYEALIRR